MIFDDNDNIWLRQSWLDTAMRCGERGRLQIVKPEWDSMSSDSAIIGTVAHAGIEAHLDALVKGIRLAQLCAESAMVTSLDEETGQGVKWTKYASRGELLANARRCYDAWVESILPVIVEQGLLDDCLTEVQFKVPLYTLADGRTVGVTGTADFVPKAPVIWDWKTSSSKFDAKKKQKFAIQPTIYALAAIKGGLRADVDYSWPLDFTFGVLVRGERKATPQLVTVRRTEAHALFAIDRIKQFVDMALNYGINNPWPANDDHFLCSKTWCPWWVLCKGATPIDDSLPTQLSL